MREIKVVFNDDSVGYVRDGKLDALILERKIKAFLRSDGWVKVGTDRVREIRYHGSERRNTDEEKPSG
jgi:hypothetical protein